MFKRDLDNSVSFIYLFCPHSTQLLLLHTSLTRNFSTPLSQKNCGKAGEGGLAKQEPRFPCILPLKLRPRHPDGQIWASIGLLEISQNYN